MRARVSAELTTPLFWWNGVKWRPFWKVLQIKTPHFTFIVRVFLSRWHGLIVYISYYACLERSSTTIKVNQRHMVFVFVQVLRTHNGYYKSSWIYKHFSLLSLPCELLPSVTQIAAHLRCRSRIYLPFPTGCKGKNPCSNEISLPRQKKLTKSRYFIFGKQYIYFTVYPIPLSITYWFHSVRWNQCAQSAHYNYNFSLAVMKTNDYKPLRVTLNDSNKFR